MTPQLKPAPRVAVHGGMILIQLATGKTLLFPANLTPALAAATDAQRRNVEFLPYTLHWPDLDEDITIESLVELGHEVEYVSNSSTVALAC